MSESAAWDRVALREVTENFDGRRVPVKESDRRPGPYPYYGASGIVDHVADYLFDGTYVLVAEDGENLRTQQTPVAFLAAGRFWVNNHAHIIRGNERADTRFLCYALRVADIRAYLTGSAMPKLTQANMNRIELLLPPLSLQRRIAAILGTLDDKIEQNQRTNTALERVARAVFKAWFVDFEPVKAKAAGATSFAGMPRDAFAALPDRLTDSPIGQVPAGWHPTDLGREFELQVGFAFKSAQFTDASDAVRLVRGDNVKEGWIEWGTKTRRWNDLNEKINQYSLAVGDVVIGMDGSKLGKNWARVREIDLPSLLVQRVARFRSTGAAGRSLMWLLISHPTFREFIEAVKTGTSIPHISGPQLKSFSFVKPGVSAPVIWSAFEHAIAPLLALADQTASESSKLAELRDYLLPRLLSGQVRVREAEKQVEAS
jgi:type I restriction enzyme S subunit